MKRIAVLAFAVTGLVGTLGVGPAAAEDVPQGPEEPDTSTCDYTDWGW